MKYFRSTQYPIEFVLSEHINKNFFSHNHANHYIIFPVFISHVELSHTCNIFC